MALRCARLMWVLVYIFCSAQLQGQPLVEDFKDTFRLQIQRLKGELILDGKLDDPAWEKTELATDFWQKTPFFAQNADPLTEVRVTYDDKYIYIGAKCFQEQKPFIENRKRDDFWGSDGFAVLLDPINAKTNCYIFASTAAGTQMDAIRGSVSDMNTDWSNKWYSEVNLEDGYFSIEMAIPFSILRYSENNPEWGINFIRNATSENEFHNWTAVPQQFWPVEPAYAGSLVWDEAPVTQTGSYNLIPYVTTGINHSASDGNDVNFNLGVDAKLAVTSSLNLDFTINPDFSQIEVDELVTNLTRFSIFLPEKRTFFLENQDIFNDYGSDAARPFFSRRIGLDENRQQVPLLFGGRVTGDIRPDVRMGIMNIQTGSNNDDPDQNYSALSVQKKFGRSFIQAMVVNRQAFDGYSTVENDYARNLSMEATYISDNGQVATWLGGHTSFKPGISSDKIFLNAGFQYSDGTWEVGQDFISMGENYYTDMGFVVRIENYDAVRDTTIRLGYRQSNSRVEYQIRPEDSPVSSHTVELENSLTYNPDWTFNERSTELSYRLRYKSGHNFTFRMENQFLDLLFPFTFNSEGEPLPAGDYQFTTYGLSYRSDDRKALSVELEGRSGSFYNGNILRVEGYLNYRVQPWGNFGMGYQINDLQFPAPHASRKISALQSKVEIGFNRDLNWTSILQYVDQSDYMGINSRLQWRYRPMSDLFLVYIDNYDIMNGIENARSIVNNNRAIVLKLSYWY